MGPDDVGDLGMKARPYLPPGVMEAAQRREAAQDEQAAAWAAIIQWPDKRLRERSRAPIQTDGILSVAAELEMLLRKAGGLGLSAIQIGIPLRICVIRWGYSEYLTLVNPLITKLSPQMQPVMEGCLSVEKGRRRVPFYRAKIAKVRYTDLQGNTRTLRGRGTWAQLLQHETDHMDGITIMERAER